MLVRLIRDYSVGLTHHLLGFLCMAHGDALDALNRNIAIVKDKKNQQQFFTLARNCVSNILASSHAF